MCLVTWYLHMFGRKKLIINSNRGDFIFHLETPGQTQKGGNLLVQVRLRSRSILWHLEGGMRITECRRKRTASVLASSDILRYEYPSYNFYIASHNITKLFIDRWFDYRDRRKGETKGELLGREREKERASKALDTKLCAQTLIGWAIYADYGIILKKNYVF